VEHALSPRLMEETSSHTVQFSSQSRRFGKQVENNYFEVVINFMKLWYFDILTSLQFVLMFDVSDFEAVRNHINMIAFMAEFVYVC